MNFEPKKLHYDNDGIPILNVNMIESISEELLEKHFPAILTSPSITPVIEVINKLERTGINYQKENLGHKGSAKILGQVNFSKKILSLDLSLFDSRKIQLQFTAAHEIGHWVLHRYNYRKWKFTENNRPDILEDDENTLCRLEKKTALDWLEWQANVFAAALIMPNRTFFKTLETAQKDIGINRNLGKIFLTDEHYSKRDFSNVIGKLAKIYDVSKKSLEIKLRTSGRIIEQVQKNPVDISQWF